MNPQAIFVPVSVLAIWTGAVLLLTGARRVLAVRRRRVPREAFRRGDPADLPDDVALPNRNLMNLLEMPVLFYVVALGFFVTHRGGGNVLVLCWLFVGLRLVHSVIHLTYNQVIHRLAVFAASNVVLLVLWISFLRRVLG